MAIDTTQTIENDEQAKDSKKKSTTLIERKEDFKVENTCIYIGQIDFSLKISQPNDKNQMVFWKANIEKLCVNNFHKGDESCNFLFVQNIGLESPRQAIGNISKVDLRYLEKAEKVGFSIDKISYLSPHKNDGYILQIQKNKGKALTMELSLKDDLLHELKINLFTTTSQP